MNECIVAQFLLRHGVVKIPVFTAVTNKIIQLSVYTHGSRERLDSQHVAVILCVHAVGWCTLKQLAVDREILPILLVDTDSYSGQWGLHAHYSTFHRHVVHSVHQFHLVRAAEQWHS